MSIVPQIGNSYVVPQTYPGFFPNKLVQMDNIYDFRLQPELYEEDKHPNALSLTIKREKDMKYEQEDKEKVTSFNKRNIFKSIVRNMTTYVKKNRSTLVKVLSDLGYSIGDIKHALFEVENYKRMEEPSSNRNRFQKLIEKVIAEKSAATYILRDSLHSMISNAKNQRWKKITARNLQSYKEVYIDYYKKTIDSLKITNSVSELLN